MLTLSEDLAVKGSMVVTVSWLRLVDRKVMVTVNRTDANQWNH